MSALTFSSFSSDLDYISKHGKDRDPARAQHRPTYTNEEKVRLAGLAPPNAHKDLDNLVAHCDQMLHAVVKAVHDKGRDAITYLNRGGSYTDANGNPVVSADGDIPRTLMLLNNALAEGIADLDHLRHWSDAALKAFGDKHAHMRHDLLLAGEEISKTYFTTMNEIFAAISPMTIEASKWKPKSPAGDGGIGAWFKKAVSGIGNFFKGIGTALKKAFDAFMHDAELALKAMAKAIDHALLAGLPAQAKKYTQGLKSKDIKAAVTAAHSKYPHELALVRSFAATRSKHPPTAVKSAMKTLAKHFEPERKKVAAHIKSVDPKSAVGSTCGFTVAEEVDASYFVGIGGSVGMEFGLTTEPEQFFDIGPSLGTQAGVNADLVVGFVVGPEANFKGWSGSIVASASDEASVLFRASFSLSPLEFQGLAIGVGVGAGIGVAGEVSYTWVGND